MEIWNTLGALNALIFLKKYLTNYYKYAIIKTTKKER